MAKVNYTPLVLDLLGVRAGDSNERRFTIKSGGVAVDLTGYTVTAQARAAATDPVPALVARVTLDDAAGGSFLLAWDGDDVAALLARARAWNGVWDLQLDNGAGPVTTVAAGVFNAVMDVTR